MHRARKIGMVLVLSSLVVTVDYALDSLGFARTPFHWLLLSEAEGSVYPDLRNPRMEQGVFKVDAYDMESGPAGVWILQSRTNLADADEGWINVEPAVSNKVLLPVLLTDTNAPAGIRMYRVLHRLESPFP